jgi:hypothetical protein
LIVYAYKININVCLTSPKHIYKEDVSDPRVGQFLKLQKQTQILQHKPHEVVKEYFYSSRTGYRRMNSFNKSVFLYHEVEKLRTLNKHNQIQSAQRRLKELNKERKLEFQSRKQASYKAYTEKIKNFIKKMEFNGDLEAYAKKYMKINVEQSTLKTLQKSGTERWDAEEKIQSNMMDLEFEAKGLKEPKEVKMAGFGAKKLEFNSEVVPRVINFFNPGQQEQEDEK